MSIRLCLPPEASFGLIGSSPTRGSQSLKGWPNHSKVDTPLENLPFFRFPIKFTIIMQSNFRFYRPGDIDMEDVGPIIDAAAMFGAFPTSTTLHLGRFAKEDDDLILMPSIPEAIDDRKQKHKSPAKIAEEEQDMFIM